MDMVECVVHVAMNWPCLLPSYVALQMAAHKLAATKLDGGKMAAAAADADTNDTKGERDQAPKRPRQQLQQQDGDMEIGDCLNSQQAVMEVTLEIDDRFNSQQAVMEVTGGVLQLQAYRL
jgi:hypothetical protein